MPIEHRRREPAPEVFRCTLPLPFPGLDRVNAYVLKDPEGSTLVDCGLFSPDPATDHGWDDVVAALAACDLVPDDIVRLVVTHSHIDHYGMAGRVVDETRCELFMHGMAHPELELYRDPHAASNRLRTMLSQHGVDEKDLDELSAFEDWRPFVASVVEASTWWRGGESFECGGRTWEVVYTPGHARSHVCLWAPGERILISGDHVLPTVTPHIDFKRDADEDPLGDFLGSLRKIEALDPALVLPGHGRPFEEGAERARVIMRHHDRRLGAILQVIRHAPRTASDVTEEIFGTTLLDFQRRLALGEALAHLEYLRGQGEIERERGDSGSYLYRKVSRTRHVEDDE